MAGQPQPLAEIASNEPAQQQVAETDFSTDEIEKLRAKLRQRTQRLKAERQQRLAENQSIATAAVSSPDPAAQSFSNSELQADPLASSPDVIGDEENMTPSLAAEISPNVTDDVAPVVQHQSDDNESSGITAEAELLQSNDDWVSELLAAEEPAFIEEIELGELPVTEMADAGKIIADVEQTATIPEPEPTEIDLAAEQPATGSEAEQDFAAALAAEQVQAENERMQTWSEMATFDLVEPVEIPTTAPLQPQHPHGGLASQAEWNEPAQDAPLPDEAQLKNLLADVEKLQQSVKPAKSGKKRSELQAILSTIPSFSAGNKPK